MANSETDKTKLKMDTEAQHVPMATVVEDTSDVEYVPKKRKVTKWQILNQLCKKHGWEITHRTNSQGYGMSQRIYYVFIEILLPESPVSFRFKQRGEPALSLLIAEECQLYEMAAAKAVDFLAEPVTIGSTQTQQ